MGVGARDPNVDENLSSYLLVVCGSIACAIILWRIITFSNSTVRNIVCMNDSTQRYFTLPCIHYESFKRHALWAPISRKRHNREMQLSTAVNIGTLPTRLQFIFLLGYLATNIAFCIVSIPNASSYRLGVTQFRSRSGTMAVVNMIPLFILAGRNNPLLKLLGVSFDTFNLLHRWFGRIVALESIAHCIAHVILLTQSGTVSEAFTKIFTSGLLYGFISTAAFAVIIIQAASPLRHAFYETFKILHIMLAMTAVIGLWYHLKDKDAPQLKYLLIAVICWGLDRSVRVIRLIYYSVDRNGVSGAVLEALPGEATRVTVSLKRRWAFSPGQHAYIYLPALSFMQSHPFSVAWSEESDGSLEDTLPLNRQDYLSKREMKVSFVIRARTGFTQSLLNKASSSPDGICRTRCLVEGPYGGVHQLDSYGTLLLFAGGVGITHQVPYLRKLVAGFANKTVATRKITLVWTIQTPEHLEWIRPWMTEILAMEKRRDILRIMLFVSRPKSTKEIQSPSATVQMFPGRPNIETLLGLETEQQIGAMAVTVCGPGALSDEVRRAVRIRRPDTTVDFIEEAFSW